MSIINEKYRFKFSVHTLKFSKESTEIHYLSSRNKRTKTDVYVEIEPSNGVFGCKFTFRQWTKLQSVLKELHNNVSFLYFPEGSDVCPMALRQLMYYPFESFGHDFIFKDGIHSHGLLGYLETMTTKNNNGELTLCYAFVLYSGFTYKSNKEFYKYDHHIIDRELCVYPIEYIK